MVIKCNIYIKLILNSFFLVNDYIYIKLTLKQSLWQELGKKKGIKDYLN